MSPRVLAPPILAAVQTYRGSRTFDTPDGRQHEQITKLYHLRATAYAPPGLKILYGGMDPELSRKAQLAPEGVRPVLRRWDSPRAAHGADD